MQFGKRFEFWLGVPVVVLEFVVVVVMLAVSFVVVVMNLDCFVVYRPELVLRLHASIRNAV